MHNNSRVSLKKETFEFSRTTVVADCYVLPRWGSSCCGITTAWRNGEVSGGALPSSSYSSIMASWARASVKTRVIVIPREYDVIS